MGHNTAASGGMSGKQGAWRQRNAVGETGPGLINFASKCNKAAINSKAEIRKRQAADPDHGPPQSQRTQVMSLCP